MPWFRSSLALLAVCYAACAQDWPQWLGPNRDGSSPEKVAPWKGELKVVWRQPVGEGHSSPVIAGGRVYLHTKVKGKEEEELAAFDAATGKRLWQTSYARAPYSGLFGSGPRATPAVVGQRVFTHGITGVLTCFNAGDGKQLWQVDTLKEFQAPKLLFGSSCSPLVDGDRLLLNVGAKDACVVAFNPSDGKVLWKALDDGASYSSPIVFDRDKARQVVFLTKEGLVSLNPADGSLLWRFALKDKLFESSTTPVRVGDLLLGSSITYGSAMLRLETKDGKPAASEVWKKNELTCYFSTPMPVGKEHVYVVTGRLPVAQANLHCVEAKTGNVLWTKAKVGVYHASLLRTADDKLLMLEEAGDLVLIDPDPKGYRELARAHVCDKTWAHPALAGGRLYIRDEKELLCVELK